MTFDEAFVTIESRLDQYTCHPTRRIIFPCENFYLARLANRIEDYPEFARRFIKSKYNAGSVEIFNVAAIDEAPTGSVIYAVEGIFDALSLLQIGAEGVVAINGAPHWKKLVDRLKTRATDGLKVVILFDDDSAGQQAAENTKQALRRAHVPAIARFLPRATMTRLMKKMTLISFFSILVPLHFESLSFKRSTTLMLILQPPLRKLKITRYRQYLLPRQRILLLTFRTNPLISFRILMKTFSVAANSLIARPASPISTNTRFSPLGFTFSAVCLPSARPLSPGNSPIIWRRLARRFFTSATK